MHHKTFGGWAPPEPAGELSDPGKGMKEEMKGGYEEEGKGHPIFGNRSVAATVK